MSSRKVLLLLLAVLIVPGLESLAGDRSFDALVRAIESSFHVRRTRIPLFGLVRPMISIARPEGVHGLKLAVFEDVDLSDPEMRSRFEASVTGSIEPAWQPFVRVRSRRDGEHAAIYIREEGNQAKLLVLALEPHEATVVEMKVDSGALARWLAQPEEMARSSSKP